MLIQPRSLSSAPPAPRRRPADVSPTADIYTPSEGKPNRLRKTLVGAAVGAGVATAACLALTGTISPLGAIVILSSGLVGGTYGYTDGNLQPPNPLDPLDPLNPWS